MTLHEIQSEIENLPPEERRKLAAFLISLRHREAEIYRSKIAAKMDDKNSENWTTLEELEQRTRGNNVI